MTQQTRHAITHDRQNHRFELAVGGETAYVEYELEPGVIVFTHTIVPDSAGGQGIGSALARHALDYATRRDLKVDPQCSFIDGWIDRHPEYRASSLAHGARR